MSDERMYAFIDECGNTSLSLDKEATSSHFILAVIIVSESKKQMLEQNLEAFRKKHFQTGEIKSKNIKADKNHRRRKMLLEELKDIDFSYYTFIIDKSMIWETSGLRHKKSFLKYLNDKLYYELSLAYPKLSIIADEHGSSDFMREFSDYIENKYPNTLLSLAEGQDFNFVFVNSKDSVLVQLADLIAGTISFGYEKGKITTEYETFYEYIKSKEIGTKEWPTRYERLEYELDENNVSEYDEIIAKTSIRIANDYLARNRTDIDIETREKVVTIEYLLRQLDISYGERYTSSKELIRYINEKFSVGLSNRYFKTKIIAKLRDNGILLSSSTKGYKIPLNKNDMYEFVNRTNTVILPMFERLSKARDRIRLATEGKVDILDREEYNKLKDFLDK